MGFTLADLQAELDAAQRRLDLLHGRYAEARSSGNTWFALEMLGDIDDTETELRELGQRIKAIESAPKMWPYKVADLVPAQGGAQRASTTCAPTAATAANGSTNA